MGRGASFRQGHTDWKPADPGPPSTPDESFDLPPDKAAYYDGLDEAQKHQDKMAGMSTAERNQYTRALREGLSPKDKNGAPTPKRGDINNPLKKDMPREPKPPASPRQPRARNPMATVRRLDKLSRMAKGRRR